jgi:hypothetical protein
MLVKEHQINLIIIYTIKCLELKSVYILLLDLEENLNSLNN